MFPFVVFFFFISPYYPCLEHEIGALSEELTPKAKPSIIDEFKIVMNRPIFICLTAAYASQTFTLIGMSTFGSSFMIGLGFFDVESQASTVFGVLISVSGLIATPLGGLLGDFCVKRKKNRYGSMTGSRTNLVSLPERGRGRGREGEDDEFDEDEYNALALGSLSSESPSRQAEQRRHELEALTKLIVGCSAAGTLLLCLNYLVYNMALYLIMVGAGCAMLFLTFSAINMGFMLAVPVENRSFAIAMMNVLIHMFGDVSVVTFISSKNQSSVRIYLLGAVTNYCWSLEGFAGAKLRYELQLHG